MQFREIEMKYIKESKRYGGECVTGSNKCVTGIPGEAIFEDIKAENCSELIRDMKPDSERSVNSKEK